MCWCLELRWHMSHQGNFWKGDGLHGKELNVGLESIWPTQGIAERIWPQELYVCFDVREYSTWTTKVITREDMGHKSCTCV